MRKHNNMDLTASVSEMPRTNVKCLLHHHHNYSLLIIFIIIIGFQLQHAKHFADIREDGVLVQKETDKEQEEEV